MKKIITIISTFFAFLITFTVITPTIVSASENFSTTLPDGSTSIHSNVLPTNSNFEANIVENPILTTNSLINQPAITENASMKIPKANLNSAEIDTLVGQLSQSYPSLNPQYVRETVLKQINGDYSISPDLYGLEVRAGWQGVTIDEMGMAIDAALRLALNVVTGGIGGMVVKLGESAVLNVLKIVAVKFFGSKILQYIIRKAISFLSPGKYLAQQWDKHDAYPNNGRINF